MAQLSQIYFTALFGGAVGITFTALFGVAVRNEWNSQLTPRAWSRPVKVVKNVLDGPSVVCGQRLVGWYSLGWVRFAMGLTYPQGLAGVPGTGTREDGWAGPTLKLNLDGVILCRYHRMLFKVSVLATVLCLGVLLPAYATSTCDPLVLGYGTCSGLWNNTNFDNLTIASVPDKVYVPNNQTLYYTLDNGTVVEVPPSTDGDGDGAAVLGRTWVAGVSWRLMACVLCSIVIYVYTCYLLWYEWIDNLALRRVYFLESDHYPLRIEELDEVTSIQGLPEDPFQARRPPYLPDPELRDTPPSVGLYSVLYQLPESLVTYGTDGATPTERRLVATVNFFDECVPPQPGFSSSVAAVTIIPDASRVARAWMRWYAVESKIRRLRYVKKVLREKLLEEEEEAAAAGRGSGRGSGSGIIIEGFLGNVLQTVKDTPAQVTGRTQGVTAAANVADTDQPAVATSSLGWGNNNKNDGDNSNKNCKNDNCSSSSRPSELNRALNSRLTAAAPDVEEAAAGINDERCKEDQAHVGRTLGTANPCPHAKADDKDARSANGTSAAVINIDNDAQGGTASVNVRRLLSGGIGVPAAGSDKQEEEDAVTPMTVKDEATEAIHFTYDDFDVIQYARKLGFDEETELVDLVDGLGIEELTVFAREYALNSAKCCVYGTAHELLRFASIDDLRDMEDEAWDDLRAANEELVAARAYVLAEDLDLEAGTELDVADEEDDVNIDCDPLIVSPSASSRPGLRNRIGDSVQNSLNLKWEAAQRVANAMRLVPESAVKNGSAYKKRCTDFIPCIGRPLKALPKYYGQVEGVGKAIFTALDHPTYAAVTFTSRQSAISVRQCLADGGATNTWRQVDDIPIPPLADAPPRNLLFCRGLCRPVTLTISYKEKKIRRFSVYAFLFFFCCLYTIPLTLTQNLMNPVVLASRYPNSKVLHDEDSIFFRLLAGMSSGLLFTVFFSFLPQLFKFVAFYEGTSSSMEKAERKALLFYWYFMLVTAFTGSSLANMLLQWFASESTAEDGIRVALTTVAASIPTQQAPTWLNWIIVRYSFTLPGGYLFQMNTFITKILGMKWLNRVMRGGGPGCPTPYRIYVDSGVVLMCIMSLAPVCPLIAPASMVYYALCQPLLRWLLVFVFKPKYDGGGDKWPQLHQIIISSMVLGQILVGVVLFLKGSYMGGITLFLWTIPTLLFDMWIRERFMRAYHDAALLQTSRLDGWQDVHSMKEREEYRRWLVDCHKASYVPVCLLGSKGNLLTSEPAVVIARQSDVDADEGEGDRRNLMQRQSGQKGAIFSRKYK